MHCRRRRGGPNPLPGQTRLVGTRSHLLKTMIRDSVPGTGSIKSCASVTMYANVFVQDAAFYLHPEDEARREALRGPEVSTSGQGYRHTLLTPSSGAVADLGGLSATRCQEVYRRTSLHLWYCAASVAAFSADNFDFSLMSPYLMPWRLWVGIALIRLPDEASSFRGPPYREPGGATGEDL